MGLKILQVNLGRGKAAHDLAFLTSEEEDVDVLVVAEPNKKIASGRRWIADGNLDVAVYFVNKNVGVVDHICRDSYVSVEFEDFRMVACYISPNIPREEYEGKVDEIMEFVRVRGGPTVVLGDFNSKSSMWSAGIQDARGEYLGDWVSALDMVVQNQWGVPTFVRRTSASTIDITLATSCMTDRIEGWRILDRESLSLHKYIVFGVRVEAVARARRPVLSRARAPRARLEAKIRGKVRRNMDTRGISRVMVEAQREAMQGQPGGSRDRPFWWCDGVEELRGVCNRWRRLLARERIRGRLSERVMEMCEREWRNKRRELSKEICRAKRMSWRELCERLEDDVWGEGYKIAVSSLRVGKPPYEMREDLREEMVSALFPEAPTVVQLERGGLRDGADDARHFAEEEVAAAVDRLKAGKAPGCDGIWPETIKAFQATEPGVLREVYNRVWERGRFPLEWKRARVVLIPKPGKEGYNSPSAFRPICLISVVGKTFEYMVKARLEEAMEGAGQLSDRQFGFRTGRSAVHAVEYVLGRVRECREGYVALVTFDVRNAFNTASWDLIAERVRRRLGECRVTDLVIDYLHQRSLEVARGRSRGQSMGVPQGSVLGPILWNIFYDDVLGVGLPEECEVVAYADDLALVAVDSRVERLKWKVEGAIGNISAWMRDNRLSIAPEKTEAVIFHRGHRKVTGVSLRHGSTNIEPKRALKYLGIWLDDNLIFGEHIKRAREKAERCQMALARLMPNVGGPGPAKRMVLGGVVQSVMLYGAPVWGAALVMKKYRQMLISVQRKAALRVISAYRTVSAEAALVIAGMVPLDLLAEERVRLHRSREGHLKEVRVREREETMNRWQTRWENLVGVGAWTRRLIPDIRRWTARKTGAVDYFLTQFLSGHGCFRAYLHRMRRADSSDCPYCGLEDTPAHVALECERWDRERRRMFEESGGETDERGLVERMFRSGEGWGVVAAYLRRVLAAKEREERGREGRVVE